MKKNIAHIIIGIVIAIYLSLAFTYKVRQKSQITAHDLKIIMHENTRYKFITDRKVYSILKKNNIHKLENTILRINKEYIEHILEENVYIKEAEVFVDPNFKVNVEVKQVYPLFRVISGPDNFYIDNERNILPATKNIHAYVHVAVGEIKHEFAKNELFDLFSKIHRDKFWNSQLDHILINEKNEAIFFVKVGVPKVYFGKIENIDEKLQNLFFFYKQTLKTLDITNYSMIDVRFKNQIICKKK